MTDSDASMVPMYVTPLQGAVPTQLAELVSIESDLRFAQWAFARLAETTDADHDGNIGRALYEAGAVAYRRVFTTGKSIAEKGKGRHKVPEAVVAALSPKQREAHEALLERADQHVAHRVAKSEQAQVLLVLNNPQVERSVAGVGILYMRFQGVGGERALLDSQTAGAIADAVAEMAEAIKTSLLESAQRRNLDDLYRDATISEQFSAPSPPPPG